MTTLRLLSLLAFVPLTAQAAPDACDGFGELVGTEAIGAGDIRIGGTGRNAHLGFDVTVIGDFDGDGIDDVAVGSPGANHNGRRSGAVYVFFGPMLQPGSFSPALADLMIAGPGAGAQLGVALSGVGDVDGDGRDDLLLGSFPANNTPAQTFAPAGAAWLVLGSDTYSPQNDVHAIASSTIYGVTPGEGFGTVVAGAGDLNGDGLADIAVGAPSADYAGGDSGAVFVFYGPVWGTTDGTAADRIFLGPRPGARAGSSIAYVDDFNGDQFTDLFIGAPNDSSQLQNAGTVFAVFGNAYGTSPLGQVPTSVDLGALSGTTPELLSWAPAMFSGGQYDRAGSAIAPAGDVDGDGFDDLWVGSKNFAANKRGAAYLLRGSAETWGAYDLDDIYTSRIKGVDVNDFLGSSIVGDFDANADGYLDVLIGAERGDGDELASGAAFVMHGPFPTDGVVGAFTIGGAEERDFAGQAIAAADVNGDGFDDVIVGAYRADTISVRSGLVSVFMGGADVTDLSPYFLDSDQDGWGDSAVEQLLCEARPGWSHRSGDCDDQDTAYHPYAIEDDCQDPNDYNCDGSVGWVDLDLDGVYACEGDCHDGRDDVHPEALEACFDDIDNNCDTRVDDGSAYDAQWWYPDVDEDGYGDRVLGVRSCERPTTMIGDLVHVGGDCDDFSSAVMPAAAEFCDGYDNDCDDAVDEDDAIDARPWYADTDGDGRGSLYDMALACSQPSGFVADARDCDDADADVHPGGIEVCNFKDDDCDGTWYRGGPSIIDQVEVELRGENAGDRFGERLAWIPDMDGDGGSEIAVAAPWYDVGADKGGAVYLRVGSGDGGAYEMGEVRADGSRRYTARITGTRPEAFLGSSVAGADLNGDGVGDLIIGARGLRAPYLYQGAVLVYFGPVEGELTQDDADLRFDGADGYDYMGISVAAGDLDGDGYDDLVMGAYREDGPGMRRGAVHVVYGGTAMTDGYVNQVADAHVYGVTDRDEIGWSVAVLGDVNGDGFTDIATGAPTAGSLDEGRVSVAYGGGSRFAGNLLVDVSYTSAWVDDEFGFSVAGPGDVNGDGFDDMMMGTANNRAFVAFGSPTGFYGGDVDVNADIALQASEDFEQLGESMSAIGDINADGFADMVVGAHRDNANGLNAGSVYIIYGGPIMPRVITTGMLESFGRVPADRQFPTFSVANLEGRFEGAKMMGVAVEGHFGERIAGGGDLNGDGHPDLLIASTQTLNDPGMVQALYTSPYGVDWEPANRSGWYTSLTVDGQDDDWLDTMAFGTSAGGGTRAIVTWDHTTFFMGFDLLSVATGSSAHHMVAYVGDGDAVGTTLGVDFGGQQPGLPFAADAMIEYSPGSNTASVRVWSGFDWSAPQQLSGAAGSSARVVNEATLELAVPRASLAVGDTLQLTAMWVYEGAGAEQSFASVPATAIVDGTFDPDMTEYLQLDTTKPLGPTHYPAQPSGGSPPVVEDTWDWWVHDRDLDGQGDDTPTFFYACPMHVPMQFPDPTDLTQLDGVIIAGVQDMALATDCDDYDPTTYLGAREVPGDGKDNDCTLDVNAAPELTIVLDAVFTDELAFVDITTTDADTGTINETPVSVEVTWYVNGVEVVGQNGPTLDGNLYFDKGDVVTVEVTATDGIDTTDPEVASFVVPNSPPVILDCELGPLGATTADDISVDCETYDADGDAVEIVPDWMGQPEADPYDGEDTIPGDTLQPNILLRAEVTPYDGEDYGDTFLTQGLRPEEVAVPIDTAPNTNGAPVLNYAGIDPDPAFHDNDLTAMVDAFDIDGDPLVIIYSWSVNGNLVKLEQLPYGGTPSTLPESYFEVGDEVVLSVVAFDGQEISNNILVNSTIIAYDTGVVDTDGTVDTDSTVDTDTVTDTDAPGPDTDTVDTDDTDIVVPPPVCVDSVPLKYKLVTGRWAYEISWEIEDLSGNVYATSAGLLYANYTTYTYDMDLPPGIYLVDMHDSYGDGWNGGRFEMIDPNTGAVLFDYSLTTGSGEMYKFEVTCDGDVIPYGLYTPELSFTICGNIYESGPLGVNLPLEGASITVAFDTSDNIFTGTLSALDGSYCITDVVIPPTWDPATEPYIVSVQKLGYSSEVAVSGVDFTPFMGAFVQLDFTLRPIDVDICWEDTFEGPPQWSFDNPVDYLGVGWLTYTHLPARPLVNDAIPYCAELPDDESCFPGSAGCTLCTNPFADRCIPVAGAIPTPWDGDNYLWFGNTDQATNELAGANFMGVGGSCQPAGGSWPDGGNGGWSVIRDIEGAVTSPVLRVPVGGDPTLQISAWFEIESVDPHKPPEGYDHLVVNVVRESDGQTFTVGSLNSEIDLDGRPGQNYASGGFGKAPVWNVYRFDLGAFAGQDIRLRFRFWSKDEKYNAFRGWGVDDVILYTTGTDSCGTP